MLEFNPNNVEVVRKDINLDGPGRMDEAVEILNEWIQMQHHFLKKDFPRHYLETTLVSAKGMVERAKKRIEKLCTFKTLMPEFFPSTITRDMFTLLNGIVCNAHMRRMSKEHYRVYMSKLLTDNFDSSNLLMNYKYYIMVSEYLKLHDYNTGFLIILDLRNINILNFITKINPLELRQIITVMTEGYGMRIKRIEILTGSKMADSLITFMKQVLSKKISDRINIHKNVDTLYEVVDKDILPEDYGGKEQPLKELYEKWQDILCSKEFVEVFQELHKARTDESVRDKEKFNEEYIGMPGSFRTLTVD